jgi:hypothetical protein
MGPVPLGGGSGRTPLISGLATALSAGDVSAGLLTTDVAADPSTSGKATVLL